MIVFVFQTLIKTAEKNGESEDGSIKAIFVSPTD